MARRLFYNCDLHRLRARHHTVLTLARDVHASETRLVDILLACDLDRSFVHIGYKSLKGYCVHGLGFTPTQAQRIVTEVRRCDVPISKMRQVVYPESDLQADQQVIDSSPPRRIDTV